MVQQALLAILDRHYDYSATHYEKEIHVMPPIDSNHILGIFDVGEMPGQHNN
jgi:hypothetical protein